jgi:hypothetical protein
MLTMADILLFPIERAVAAAHPTVAPPPQAEVLAAEADGNAWSEDDTADDGSLEKVASLAATPSQSLAVLVTKMEVLVTRLAPEDGTDAGLCLAEASLLRSVLCDLRAFAMDTVFAAQGAGLWAPVSAGANLVKGTGAG